MRHSSFPRRVLRSFGPTLLGVLLFIGGGVAAHADGLPTDTVITSSGADAILLGSPADLNVPLVR